MALRAHLRQRPRSRTKDEELDPFEAAVLADGERRAAAAALTQLLEAGALELDGERVACKRPLPTEATKLERRLYEAVRKRRTCTVATALSRCASATAELRASLENRGLLETPASFADARTWTSIVWVPVLLLGLTKLMVGMMRGKPVLFLLLACAATVFALVLFRRVPYRTIRGERVLSKLAHPAQTPRRPRVRAH